MSAEEIAQQVVDILNEHHIPYMLVGSWASNYHSTVRSTKDADFVIQADLGKVASLIGRHCDALVVDRQLGFESVTATTKILLRAKDEEFSVELFGLSDDPHDRERFARREQVDLEGHAAWICTAEDSLITKLRWAHYAGRKKDLADAENIVAVSGEMIDWPYVERWCDEHGSRPLLEQIRAELRGHDPRPE
jgi:hypothetical protein